MILLNSLYLQDTISPKRSRSEGDTQVRSTTSVYQCEEDITKHKARHLLLCLKGRWAAKVEFCSELSTSPPLSQNGNPRPSVLYLGSMASILLHDVTVGT